MTGAAWSVRASRRRAMPLRTSATTTLVAVEVPVPLGRSEGGERLGVVRVHG